MLLLSTLGWHARVHKAHCHLFIRASPTVYRWSQYPEEQLSAPRAQSHSQPIAGENRRHLLRYKTLSTRTEDDSFLDRNGCLRLWTTTVASGAEENLSAEN